MNKCSSHNKPSDTGSIIGILQGNKLKHKAFNFSEVKELAVSSCSVTYFVGFACAFLASTTFGPHNPVKFKGQTLDPCITNKEKTQSVKMIGEGHIASNCWI